MSEINKVYKKYGEIAGKQYLVLFYSSSRVGSRLKKGSDNANYSAFKARLDDYIKKEWNPAIPTINPDSVSPAPNFQVIQLLYVSSLTEGREQWGRPS